MKEQMLNHCNEKKDIMSKFIGKQINHFLSAFSDLTLKFLKIYFIIFIISTDHYLRKQKNLCIFAKLVECVKNNKKKLHIKIVLVFRKYENAPLW
jgi:hypothetical protein